jgi:hypothetical protein
MHFAVQPTSPRAQALMHFVISDCDVSAGDSLVVDVTVARVVGVVVVVWALAMASRPDRRTVVKRILMILNSNYWISSSREFNESQKEDIATVISDENECNQAALRTRAEERTRKTRLMTVWLWGSRV